MKPGSFIAQAERHAKVIDALHVSRYTLVTHDGLTVRSEGEQWTMDFRPQIAQLTEAMELLGHRYDRADDCAGSPRPAGRWLRQAPCLTCGPSRNRVPQADRSPQT